MGKKLNKKWVNPIDGLPNRNNTGDNTAVWILEKEYPECPTYAHYSYFYERFETNYEAYKPDEIIAWSYVEFPKLY